MSEYATRVSGSEGDATFANSLTAITAVVVLTGLVGYVAANQGPEADQPKKQHLDIRPVPEQPKLEKFKMRVGEQTLRCSVAADKYGVTKGDNAWNIVRTQTVDYPDSAHISPLFFGAWDGTVKLNQQEDRIGPDANLIYPGDLLKTLRNCVLVQSAGR